MYASDPENALVPLFIRPKYSDALQRIGTGILVDFQSQPFLYTAAHVTDNTQRGELMVPIYGGIAPIDGYLGYVDLLSEMSRAEDKIDIAYYRLSTKFAQLMLAHFKPLPQSRSMLMKSTLELGMCSVYGYPASRAKHFQGKHFSESATYRGVAADEIIYNMLGLSPDLSIVIHFDRKQAVSMKNGKPIEPISPNGISGGGIFSWPVGHEFSNDWTLPKLVGIFHTYKKTEGLMVGTSLLPICAAIQVGQMKGFGGVV